MKRSSRRFWLMVILVVSAIAAVPFVPSLHAAVPMAGAEDGGTADMASGHTMPAHPHSMADASPQHPMMQHGQGTMMQHGQGMGAGGAMPGMHSAGAGGTPALPGQDAFGAIQEIVGILDADPTTDWSKVDLEALRQHLIDMNEVTLRADAKPKPVEGGLEIAVTGAGRTRVAIQRMIPEWATMANGLNGWTTKADSLPNGEMLTVTATAPEEIQHIRGLGFIGLLASGSWHQAHHLAMAKGTFQQAP